MQKYKSGEDTSRPLHHRPRSRYGEGRQLWFRVAFTEKNDVDTLILGCTHFPHLHDIIQDIMGENVALISSGAELAKFAVTELTKENALCDRQQEGRRELYCTDSVELFTETAATFLGKDNHAQIAKCTLKT